MTGTKRHWSTQAGSTLIEALVATIILTTGLLAMAELIRIATSSNVRARRGSFAAILAGQKLEELKSLAWEFDVSGAPVSDVGLRASPWSLQRNTPGFVDHVGGDGQIVGEEVAPPVSALYTRRWSVEPLPAGGGDVLLIQVLVTGTGNRGLADRGSVAHLPGEARFLTIRTRKAP
jgi:type II secretory pathway pseudopilin PulG